MGGEDRGMGRWDVEASCWFVLLIWGPLIRGPRRRLAILRNGNVPCRYVRNFPGDFKIVQCRLSILRIVYVPCHHFKNFPVDFKIF